MYKKHCTRCYKPSYSSCQTGEWRCPTCNNDLTKKKAILTSNQTNLSVLYKKYEVAIKHPVNKEHISFRV